MAADLCTNIDENKFWLQIMGDYASFIRNRLGISEENEILKAQEFITLYDKLLTQAGSQMSPDQIKLSEQQFYERTQEFKKFILHLVNRLLSEEISFTLSTDYLNHIINQTEIYLTILSDYMSDGEPIQNPIMASPDWLLNIYIESSLIHNLINTTYYLERKKIQAFSDEFLKMYYQAYVFEGLRRTGLNRFPAIDSLNCYIKDAVTQYAEYLADLISLKNKKILLGPITLLELDNSYRMSRYYITKLELANNEVPPVCTPTIPEWKPNI